MWEGQVGTFFVELEWFFVYVTSLLLLHFIRIHESSAFAKINFHLWSESWLNG